MFVLRAILYWLILLVLFSFVIEESLVWFFPLSGSHCRFNFPLSSRVIKHSPSPHSLKRLRVLMVKTFSAGKEGPGGSRKGALNLVSKRSKRPEFPCLASGENPFFLPFQLSLPPLFSILFPLSWILIYSLLWQLRTDSTCCISSIKASLIQVHSLSFYYYYHYYFNILNTFFERTLHF